MLRVRFNGSGAQPTLVNHFNKQVASIKVTETEKEARALAVLFKHAPELLALSKRIADKFEKTRKKGQELPIEIQELLGLILKAETIREDP